MATDNTKKAPAAPKKEKRSLKEYMKGVRLEMRKVIWPTKKELVNFSVVVIAVCAFFALGFWAVDSAVLATLREVLGITM
jgi:preprotein translocase subunit SecE